MCDVTSLLDGSVRSVRMLFVINKQFYCMRSACVSDERRTLLRKLYEFVDTVEI
jgi:hypothetical protein